MKAGELFVELGLVGLQSVNAGLQRMAGNLSAAGSSARGLTNAFAGLNTGGVAIVRNLSSGLAGIVGMLGQISVNAMNAFVQMGRMEEAGNATKATTQAFDGLVQTAQRIGLQFVEMVNSVFGTADILTAVGEGLKGAWETVSPAVMSVIEAVKAVGGAVAEMLGSVFGNVNGLGTFIVEKITDWAKRAQFVAENWRDYFALAKASAILSVQNLWERIKTWAINVIEIIQWAIENWKELFVDLVNFAKTVFENLWKNVKATWQSIKSWLSGGKFEAPDWTPLTEGFKSQIKELPKLTKANVQESTAEIDQLRERLGARWAEFTQQPASAIPAINEVNKSRSTEWQVKTAGTMLSSGGSAFVGVADLARQQQEATLKRLQERQLEELQKTATTLLNLYTLASQSGIKLASGAPAVYQ